MMANTIKRGLFHALATLLFPLSSLSLPRAIFLAGTAALMAALLLIEFFRLNFASINRRFIFLLRPVMREREFTALAASTYVAISALAAFLLFQKQVAVVAMCFLAIGDPLSGIVGTRFGRRKMFAKSMEDNLACWWDLR
jgi:dolichol kinase